MKNVFFGAAVIPALIAVSPHVAANAVQEPVADDITIQGLTRGQLGTIVNQLAEPGPDGVIPKFRDWLCVGVYGLKPSYSRLISRRIVAVAQDTGIRIRTGRCTPNVLIVAPQNPDDYTADLVRKHPMLWGPPDRGMAPARLISALRTPRPVRWFGVTASYSLKGGMWRLSSPTKTDKLAVYVILDVAKMTDVTWDQLGDYIAMAAFANPTMGTSYPAGTTALSVFDDRDAGKPTVTGLTTFDRSLLSAVHKVDEGLSPRLQRQKIIYDLAHRNEKDSGEKAPDDR